MTNASSYYKADVGHIEPALKQLFDRYAEESITEEQVRHVLEPVLRMISEGRFDEPPTGAVSWPAKTLTLITLTTVAAMATFL